MKKILVVVAVAMMAVAANAAAFSWRAGNIYGADGTTKWSGEVTLFATGIADAIYSTTASAGTINIASFTTDKVTGGNYYDFYMVIEDSGKKFTSSTVSVGAQATATAAITFGNMTSQTQNASNWAAVPEPTSGLLMLLGVAGLALKRKRA